MLTSTCNKTVISQILKSIFRISSAIVIKIIFCYTNVNVQNEHKYNINGHINCAEY